MRYIVSIAFAACITFFIFYLMSFLVKGGKALEKQNDLTMVMDFVRLKRNSDLETKKREIPKKPPPPKSPPKIQKMNVAKNDVQRPQQLDFDLPDLDLPTTDGGGPYLGQPGGGQSGDATEMPLVRMEPQYPRDAAMNGIEGTVLLQFDVTETGTVDNVKVLEINPRRQRSFGKEARRALLKWKYKPKLVDGKPTRQEGLVVSIDFKLEGS